MKKIMFIFLLTSLFIGVRSVDAKSCTYYYNYKSESDYKTKTINIVNNNVSNSVGIGNVSDCSNLPGVLYMNPMGAYFCKDSKDCGGSSAIQIYNNIDVAKIAANVKEETGSDLVPGDSENIKNPFFPTGGGSGGTTLPDDGENPSYSGTGGGENFMDNPKLSYRKCGDLDKIPAKIPTLTSFAYNALKILTPVVLIIMGMFELMKSIMSGKEDEIKKTQSSFIKKLLAAALVFLIASIVQFVFKFTAKSQDSGPVISCMECFLNDNC